jgi:hypothetical protein
MRGIALLLCLAGSLAGAADPVADHLRANGKPPLEYVLSRLDAYPIVIVGEAHWIRSDAELIRAAVPHLRARGVALATEFYLASDQEKIDRLVSSPEWDAALANEIMRAAEWPYVQYRDILQAAWRANRVPGDAAPLRVIGLQPPADWREKKISYDGFMADRIREHAGPEAEHRVLVYCGMHHAFTRYQQVERGGPKRALEFMDRAGNILWRRYGQNVFLIAMHRPEWCGAFPNETSLSCLPFGGAIDCAAAELGNPVAFDVIGSPIAELKFPESSFYAKAHPHLRFMDYTDGYVWTEPVDRARRVDLIPLEEYSPESAKDAGSMARWTKRADDLAHPLRGPGLKGLAEWRSICAKKQ